VEQPVAQEEPVPERARDVLVAERVGFRPTPRTKAQYARALRQATG